MSIKVEGLTELVRDFRRIETALAREIQNELKKTVEPVVQSARSKVGRYRGSKPEQIRPRVSTATVFVRQNARKVTGKRGDFGALQMKRALIPALEENESKIVRGVDEMLNRMGNRFGF